MCRPFEGKTVDAEQILEYLRRDHFLSKKAAANYLDWSVRKLGYCLGEIPHYRHRGTIYFKRSQLDRYMAGFEVRAGLSEERKLRELARRAMVKLHEP